jgi:hypothetical protein
MTKRIDFRLFERSSKLIQNQTLRRGAIKMHTKTLMTGFLVGLGLLLAGNTSLASDRFHHPQRAYDKGRPAKSLHVDGRKRSVRIHKKRYYGGSCRGEYRRRGYHPGRYPDRGCHNWRHSPRRHPYRGYYYRNPYPKGCHRYPFRYRCYPGWVFGFSFGGFF